MRRLPKYPKTFVPYKGRRLDLGLSVAVYRNLHRGGYSVRQRGVIVGHADRLVLSHCQFVVSESGRLRVIASGHKNVHAYVRGMVSPLESKRTTDRVRYDPKVNRSFVDQNGKPVRAAAWVYLGKFVGIVRHPQK